MLELITKITKEQARAFYADVLGTFHTNGSDGVVSAAFIADRMGISETEADHFLRACANYGITERQGGGWVI